MMCGIHYFIAKLKTKIEANPPGPFNLGYKEKCHSKTLIFSDRGWLCLDYLRSFVLHFNNGSQDFFIKNLNWQERTLYLIRHSHKKVNDFVI